MPISIRVTAGEGSISRFIVPSILVATGIGIVVWYQQQALGLMGWQRYIPYAVGGLFVVGGLRSILGELRRGADREAAQRALEEHREAPWRVRPEWRSNELLSEGRLDRSFVGLALFWNLLSWPLAAFLIRAERGSGDQAVWLVGLFPAIGLGMLGKLVFELLRARKYGRTRVALDAMPLRLGGSCRGRMRVKLDREAAPEDGFLVRVSCYRQEVRYRRDSDGKRKRRIERDLLWRDESRLRGDPTMDGTAMEVPFAFTLPDGMPASTALKLDNRILWELSAEAAVPGIDFQAAVEVPVFPPESGAVPESEAPGETLAATDAAEERAEDPVPAAGPASRDRALRKPLSPGIVLVEEPDLFELHFTADRKRKGAVGLGITGVVLLLVGFPVMGVSGAVGFIFLLMGGFLVYGSIQQGTNDTVLRVRDGRVSVAHDGIGMPADVQFPVGQVEDVVVDLGSGSSQNARYAIALLARAGEGLEDLEEQADGAMGLMSKLGVGENHPAMKAMKEGARRPRIPVAADFAEKEEADWLAARIREAIGGEVSRPA